MTQPYKKIGIGVTFSPNLAANIAEATRLALKTNTALILIHVGGQTPEKEEKFASFMKEFVVQGGRYELVYQKGDPVEVILSTIKNHQIDLLILGALKKENLIKYYVGSIARKITRKAPCSVLLLINPSVDRVPCNHIVVNGIENQMTKETIEHAFYFGKTLTSKKLTIVEEIGRDEIGVKIDDDRSLKIANMLKEKRAHIENERVEDIIHQIPEEIQKDIQVIKQPIFGKRGYSISHYSEIARADLLVTNSPRKTNFWQRLFPNDIEYILGEIPTDILIVR